MHLQHNIQNIIYHGTRFLSWATSPVHLNTGSAPLTKVWQELEPRFVHLRSLILATLYLRYWYYIDICKCWIIVTELYTWSSISSKLDEDLDIKTNRRIIVQILKFKQLNFHEEFWQRTEEFHLAFCADICPTYLLFTWRTLLWAKSCFKTIIIPSSCVQCLYTKLSCCYVTGCGINKIMPLT